jgi:hypothetical protein
VINAWTEMPQHWPDSLAGRAVIEVVADAPSAASVAEAISACERRSGARGCAGRMAQEFGDQPQGAAERMRWCRRAGACSHGAWPSAANPRKESDHLPAKESFHALRITHP